jgi:hypothetical protein
MRNLSVPLVLALLLLAFPVQAQRPATSTAWLDPHRDAASRLLGEALSTRFAWDRLAELGDTYGHRLSGSQALEDAIDWAVEQMKKDGLENVRKEPVKVPHWVRGQESLEIVAPRRHTLVMLGLGNSVGTPADGIEAELLIVRSFQELDAAGPRVKGRSFSTTCRSAPTARRCAIGRPARPGPRRSVRWRRWFGPSGRRDSAHRTPARSHTIRWRRRYPRQRSRPKTRTAFSA